MSYPLAMQSLLASRRPGVSQATTPRSGLVQRVGPADAAHHAVVPIPSASMETCTPPRVRVLTRIDRFFIAGIDRVDRADFAAAASAFFDPAIVLHPRFHARTLSACHDDSSARDSAHCEEMLSDSPHHERIK